MFFSMMPDTIAKTTDGSSIQSIIEDSVTVTVRLTPYFQKWNYGLATNYGISLKNSYDFLNLDRFVFYGPSVQDTSKRPKLLIRYTPRENNEKEKYFWVIISFLVISNFSYAQDEFHVGSLYSAFGIGDIRYSASIRTDMMGIQGIGLFGNYVNTLNPASNTYLRNTYVTLGLKGILLNTSNDIESAKYSDFNVTGFNLGVPVWNDHGMVLLFGFNPYSTMQYKITGVVNQNGTTFTETFAGLGGLTRLNFGLAGRPLRFLSLGAEYNYAFGNIKNITFFNFNSQYITNTYIKTENELKGSFFKTGAVLEFGSLFPRSRFFDNLNLGFFLSDQI